MDRKNNWPLVLRVLSYFLVAVLAAASASFVILRNFDANKPKLVELENVIKEKFIGEVDATAIEDAAAAAMVNALGNRWSYYIPESEYGAYMENQNNTYEGIGITISAREDKTGYDILKVEPDSGAEAAGIQVGDILTHIGQRAISEISATEAKTMIQGAEGTTVRLSILRDGETLQLDVERKKLNVTVAAGQMLDDGIGLVTITNFNERCAEETIAVIEQLLEQDVKALIFDVRFNPGGYKEELVDLLDYLLPEGDLFCSTYYSGKETVDTSDAQCLEMPMAVLINDSSYSAAEFFAAALSEYDWAVLVGQATTGKSHFQNAILLSDGSAVNLSVGEYFTPKGVSLADVGGLKPDVTVDVDKETYSAIYYDQLSWEDDPQIKAAVEALKNGN